MAFYRILPDTELQKRAYDVFHFQDAWVKEDFVQEFEEKIGVSPMSNLGLDRQNLKLKDIPEGQEKNFRKEKYFSYHCAVKNSKLNKTFLELVEKYNLTVAHPYDIAFAIKSEYRNHMTVHPFEDDKYVIELPEDEFLNDVEALERMTEADFYQWKADEARENGL